MRFIIALIIITLVISYVIIPVVPTIRKLFNSFTNRLERTFNKNKKEDNEEEF